MNKSKAISHIYPSADPLREFIVMDKGEEWEWLTQDGKRPTKPEQYRKPIEDAPELEEGEEPTEGVHYTIETRQVWLPDEDMIEGVHYEVLIRGQQIVKWEIRDDEGNLIPQPTEEDLLAVWEELNAPTVLLQKAKTDKMKELREACNAAILGRFQAIVDGNVYFFSCDNEAQANFSGAAWAFDKGKIATHPWTAHTALVGGEAVRIVLTATAFDDVNVARLMHVAAQVSRLRDSLEAQVQAATSEAEVAAIAW